MRGYHGVCLKGLREFTGSLSGNIVIFGLKIEGDTSESGA
jgi:hypothetical protein